MKKKSNLTMFMNQLIATFKKEGRYGTAHIYQSTLNAFIQFCKTDNIPFCWLERSFLKKFETYLRQKGNAWNTVSTYMRTLRSTYNKASDENIVPIKARLFHHVYTGVKSHTKRAIEAGDMNKLLNSIPPRPLSSPLEESRTWMKLMFMLRGMPFVDLAHLHKKDLQESTIYYRRYKTGSSLSVQVPAAALKLIEQCRNHDPESPYLFPILSGKQTGEKGYTEYQHALRKLNHDLKQLAIQCGIKAKISSYTSRHTWATLAKYCHFSEQLICEALGHSSVKVTETYLKNFRSEDLSRANEVIIKYINKA